MLISGIRAIDVKKRSIKNKKTLKNVKKRGQNKKTFKNVE